MSILFVALFVVTGIVVYQLVSHAAAITEIKSGMSTASNWCMTHQSPFPNWVVTQPCDGGVDQQWEGSGTHLVNQGVYCLTPTGYGRAPGTQIVWAGCNSQPAENWKPYSGGFLNTSSGLCLADPHGILGAILTIEPCASYPDQNWTVVTLSSGCGSGIHATPGVAQCIGSNKAGAIWDLNATTYINGGPYGLQPANQYVSNWGCLKALWNQESGWHWDAKNPSSGAYGIPQALPASKMYYPPGGPDYLDNAATQINWGLGYIKGRYGNPCGAWQHEVGNNWYGPETPAG